MGVGGRLRRVDPLPQERENRRPSLSQPAVLLRRSPPDGDGGVARIIKQIRTRYSLSLGERVRVRASLTSDGIVRAKGCVPVVASDAHPEPLLHSSSCGEGIGHQRDSGSKMAPCHSVLRRGRELVRTERDELSYHRPD